MVLEARIAERLGIAEPGTAERIDERRCARAGLPVARPARSVRGRDRRRDAARQEGARRSRRVRAAGAHRCDGGRGVRLGAPRRRSAGARGAGVTSPATRSPRRTSATDGADIVSPRHAWRGAALSLGTATMRARAPDAAPAAPLALAPVVVLVRPSASTARSFAVPRATGPSDATSRCTTASRCRCSSRRTASRAPRAATGTCAQGIVAADPRLFPLGRYVELYVGRVYYGRFLVDDTGGEDPGRQPRHLDADLPRCAPVRPPARHGGARSPPARRAAGHAAHRAPGRAQPCTEHRRGDSTLVPSLPSCNADLIGPAPCPHSAPISSASSS